MKTRQLKRLAVIAIGILLVLPLLAVASNDQEQMRQKRMQALHHIEPVGNPLTASLVIGKTVKDKNGKDIGEIEELVINRTGRVTHAIVSSDGFLEIGEDLIPVPWEVFDLDREMLITPHDGAMRLSVNKSTLMGAPRIDGPKYPVPSDVTKLDIANQYFKDEIMQRHREWRKEFWSNDKNTSGNESKQS